MYSPVIPYIIETNMWLAGRPERAHEKTLYPILAGFCGGRCCDASHTMLEPRAATQGSEMGSVLDHRKCDRHLKCAADHQSRKHVR